MAKSLRNRFVAGSKLTADSLNISFQKCVEIKTDNTGAIRQYTMGNDKLPIYVDENGVVAETNGIKYEANTSIEIPNVKLESASGKITCKNIVNDTTITTKNITISGDTIISLKSKPFIKTNSDGKIVETSIVKGSDSKPVYFDNNSSPQEITSLNIGSGGITCGDISCRAITSSSSFSGTDITISNVKSKPFIKTNSDGKIVETSIVKGSDSKPVYFDNNSAPQEITSLSLSGNISGANISGTDVKVTNVTSAPFLSTDGNGKITKKTLTDKGSTSLPVYVSGNDFKTISSLDISGAIKCSNVSASAYYQSSDRRLKENIKNVNLDYQDLLNNLEIKEFNFITDEDKITHLGVIAQDLEQVIPEKYRKSFVKENDSEDKTLVINEMKLVYLVIGALKEEIEKRKELEKIIEDLKSK